MDYREHHKLNQEFLERFPLEKLKDMTLDSRSDRNSDSNSDRCVMYQVPDIR